MAIKSLGIGALAATVCLSLGAVSAHADTFGTVSFDDLTLDTQYSVGNATTSDGVDITFGTFYWLPGDTPFDGGVAEVHSGNNSGGSGLDLGLNNINAYFNFGADVSSLTVLYGDFGGNLNIIVNDLLVNVGDWSAIHNTTIAGVRDGGDVRQHARPYHAGGQHHHVRHRRAGVLDR